MGTDILPKTEHLDRSIDATTDNGKKLLDDAKLLFDWDRFGTALALAVLAQEEFAKAFLLRLVADGALPWIPEVQRSMARHQCKHLLAIVMEWLGRFDVEEMTAHSKRNTQRHEQKMAWLERRISRYKEGSFGDDPNDPEPVEPDVAFPEDVATALNIYRHEEIERMKSGYAWRDPEWSKGKARDIADGAMDRVKQTAIYVDISKTGEVGRHPGLITRDQAVQAIEAATRLSEGASIFSDEYGALKEVLPAIFQNLRPQGT
jgi:AbiV family abortive infection protein